ncbi:GNAT family N-acetyltransferase [Actinocatenispora sera]|uniref:N-acetyltransferase n=1 Tax=Actinocatenispora sera TaxID=390989 RepID=A0A810L1W4_9ACTN|nr:GNAT family N-acetyltransferase [Actinocatenispora sera]BCJ28168.1 N-acetyltransferase [Actinocatenispora sera]
MIELDTSALALAYRAEYDDQLRARAGNSYGGTIERVGPLVRKTAMEGTGFVLYRDLGGLRGAELDALIDDQVRHYAALGQSFEWKWHHYDEPSDLTDRLRAKGFTPEEAETIHIGPVGPLAVEGPAPAGVVLREVTERTDLDRIRSMAEEVWGFDFGWLPDALSRETSGPDDDPTVVVVAEAGGRVVCASWIRFHTGTEFASLWGGSTLEQWRRRGIYRSLVAYRARLAAARGYAYLQVDASPDSRPILTRLGLLPVAVTVPYIWRPSE